VCYIKGPSRVGNGVLAREGMLDMIIAMADSGSAVHVVSSAVNFSTVLLLCVVIQNCIKVVVILQVIVRQQGHAVSKTLFRQNPSVLNWGSG